MLSVLDCAFWPNGTYDETACDKISEDALLKSLVNSHMISVEIPPQKLSTPLATGAASKIENDILEVYRNNQDDNVSSIDLLSNEKVISDEILGNMFESFINNFKTENSETYFHQFHTNVTLKLYTIIIQLDHINSYSSEMYSHLIRNPLAVLEAFERGVCKLHNFQNFQVQIVANSNISKIRDINSNKSNRIIKIQGIVVSASSIITKPKELYLQCKNCQNVKKVKDGIPRNCDNSECPLDPYFIVPEKSIVEDIQYIKIQEFFEDIPMGETPRHFNISLSGVLANKISPGCQVKISGVYCIKNTSEKSFPFIRALGLENNKNKVKKSFSEEEESFFRDLSKQDIYERVSRSIAPSIFGKKDVKKALACMLFGGTRRIMDDGINLRGDINILLLGDPGIAKSQFLKFVELVSPISVYTSGKGSSAAGLTASVIKDRNNEFYLEGGALVLADNGVCCIDEFDKMNEHDRVAIHEAMEQQTISIAKAGITTVLNTKTSILAAANPIFGRYDDFKTPAENIEFGSTILSRFDCIFILKDKFSNEDRITAEHVLQLHTNQKRCKEDDVIDVDTLRNYIQYAKAKVFPTMNEMASQKLNKFYVNIRQQVNEYENETSSKSSVPITVRQLEAIIRLSESLAKIELNNTVSVRHVDEAIRLFQLSTMNAVSQGHQIEGMYRSDYFEQINEVIQKIKDVMPIGGSKRFVELAAIIGVEEAVMKRAIDYLVKQNKIVSRDYGRMLTRLP
ncbi:unnamed protein product [Medioppia subpectinata]|uniref:DNA replication licensing factor MCM5 n=1 Tax=Medioppia subpectinata TaxID=1979941 RepID=A0A7R9KFT2_9ACAR|nr:unnamed protein product [Medioppia subpectinata]CAG2102577.1 unnamed protein product [Medioppia subpectinata]